MVLLVSGDPADSLQSSLRDHVHDRLLEVLLAANPLRGILTKAVLQGEVRTIPTDDRHRDPFHLK